MVYERLDDARRRAELDSAGMTAVIEGFAAQCEEAWRVGKEFAPGGWDDIRSVVVLGVGGSAIGGDLLKAYTEGERRVPMELNRDYTLPAYVDSSTLVIACSYSGNTEETLSAYEEAARRGARIVALSTGGELASRCEGAGHPMIRLPGGLAPRAALGYTFVPLLVLFERLGLIGPQEEQFAEALQVLRSQDEGLASAVPAAENPAKRHAVALLERIPLIYGRNGWPGVVAARWKAQINENAKHPAWFNAIPELNHNEIMGWEAVPELNERTHVFLLRDRGESPAMRRRIDVTARLVAGASSGLCQIAAEGESTLAQLLSLVHYGDYVSLYLGLAKGLDPTPIGLIDRLKEELARTG